jgi:hypothetical protein
VLRIAVGTASIVWALLGAPIWAWVGEVALATGLINFCPAYSRLGITTCKTKELQESGIKF